MRKRGRSCRRESLLFRAILLFQSARRTIQIDEGSPETLSAYAENLWLRGLGAPNEIVYRFIQRSTGALRLLIEPSRDIIIQHNRHLPRHETDGRANVEYVATGSRVLTVTDLENAMADGTVVCEGIFAGRMSTPPFRTPVAQCALDLDAVLLTRDEIFRRIARHTSLRLAR